MIKLALTIAVALIWSSSEAAAAQCRGEGPELKTPVTCSIGFNFDGACGEPKYPYKGWDDIGFAVGPWEKEPIRITAAVLDVMLRAAAPEVGGIVFAGDSWNADLITPQRIAVGFRPGPQIEAVAVVHSAQQFPADAGMQFAAKQPMEHLHIDAHIFCWPEKTGHYFGRLTIWYRLDP